MLLARPVCVTGVANALKKACRSATELEYPQRTLLFPQGLPADFVFFMISGLAKLTFVDCLGKEIIVAVRRTGWLLGATAAILKQPQPTGAVTLTQCQLLRIPAEQITTFLETESALSKFLHELQAQDVEDHLQNIVELASHSTEQRLAKLLYDLVRGMASSHRKTGGFIKIPFKQWEIAELLTVTPEHICRVLRSLEQGGLVKRKGKFLFISEPEKLLSLIES